jgi:3-oxoacyl-[acyl-carrier protein] reductase
VIVFSLHGRRALVTGGAGSLGRSVVKALAEQGARVIVADRVTPAEGFWEVLGVDDASCGSVVMEVTDEASVIRGLREASDHLAGSLDIVVNAAGIGEAQAVETMSFAQWRHMVGVHLDGTFLVARHSVSAMLEQRWGRLICFSSIAATQAIEFQAHYAAAKAGVEAFVRSMSVEVADRGVTVNAIAPGYFESSLNDLASPQRLARLRDNVPVGRFGDPAEIGALAVYLASNEAAYLTGEVVSPHGGFRYSRLLNHFQ